MSWCLQAPISLDSVAFCHLWDHPGLLCCIWHCWLLDFLKLFTSMHSRTKHSPGSSHSASVSSTGSLFSITPQKYWCSLGSHICCFVVQSLCSISCTQILSAISVDKTQICIFSHIFHYLLDISTWMSHRHSSVMFLMELPLLQLVASSFTLILELSNLWFFQATLALLCIPCPSS